MVEIGVDINKSWSFNEQGDLKLVTDNDNLVQAVYNRLSCYKPLMDIYYLDYGGFLSLYYGKRRTQETLNFMRIEIEYILQQEPRILYYDLDLNYADDGAVKIDLNLSVNNEEVEVNMVASANGIELIEDEEEE